MKLSAAYLRGGMHQVEISDDGLIGALSSQGKRAADEPGLSPATLLAAVAVNLICPAVTRKVS